MNKGERTRAAILDTALAMASKVGLEGLSIGNLAREVGLSKSGLFGHFESKENLQLQVIDTAVKRFVDRVIAPAVKEPRGVPRIKAFFDRWLGWEQHSELLPGGCPFISMGNELDDRPGPTRDRLVGCQKDWIAALAQAARIAVEEGHLRSDLDVQLFAYDFYSIMLAYHHFSRLIRDSEAERHARQSFERLLQTSLPD